MSVAELLLAFGVAELTPKNAIGQPGLMKALVQAQRGSLERAKTDVFELRGANAALDDALKQENSALACQVFHTNGVGDGAGALRAFVGGLSSLLPRSDELQALDGATDGGVTHVLGPKWGERIELEQRGVPRHAVDSVLLHTCRTSPDTPVRFSVQHPPQRSGPLWYRHMQPTPWGEHLAWHTDGGGTRQVTVGSPAACKGLAHRR